MFLENSFILMSTPVLTILIVLPSVLVIGSIVFLVIWTQKRHSRLAVEYRRQYDFFHSILINNCRTALDRMNELGKSSPLFKKYAEDNEKQYQDILSHRDQEFLSHILILESIVARKKEKTDVKTLEIQLKNEAAEYQKSVATFNDDLANRLRDDEDSRGAIVSDRTKYRSIQTFYQNNESLLKPLENTFSLVLRNVENLFVSYDSLVNEAKFEEAKALLPKLDQILDSVLSVMDQFPDLENSVHAIIPKMMEETTATYQQMIQDQYSLDFLQIPETLADIAAKNQALNEKLRYMDAAGVKESVDDLINRIAALNHRLAEEKTAKETFESNKGNLTFSTFDISKKYSQIIKALPEYQRVFVLSENQVTQILHLKDDIERIGYLKRDFDSYLDTNARSPYSDLVKKMNEMQASITHVNEAMTDYKDYLQKLKDDSQFVYQNLRTYFVKLRQAEYEVRMMDIDAYTASVMPRFVDLYQRLLQLNALVVTPPINVLNTKTDFDSFQKACDDLVTKIAQESADNLPCQGTSEREKYLAAVTPESGDNVITAEALIVYTNPYYPIQSDSRSHIQEAEKDFRAGNFSATSATLAAVIGQFGSCLDEDVKA